MESGSARYREFAPCEALRQFVSAFFSFSAPARNDPPHRLITREVVFGADDPFSSPLFADARISIVFNFGMGYRIDGLWDSGTCGHVIGAVKTARATSFGERLEIGVRFRAAQQRLFMPVPACELTDRIASLPDLWGREAVDLEIQLREAKGEGERIDLLESALLGRLACGRMPRSTGLDVPALTAFVLRRKGRVAVDHLADAAGVSRQHLTRAFRDALGVTPKLYCRLARFRAALGYAGDWAEVALKTGYADQSHMIAEFREFSGLTPAALLRERRFHPFIERPLNGNR